MYYSFIILKPDALERQLVSIIVNRLIENNVKVEIFNYTLVDESIIFEHYEHKIEEEGEIFKFKASKTFAGKYVIPMIISSHDPNIIVNIRKLIGTTDPLKAEPGTIRGDLSNDSLDLSNQEVRCCDNLIHASDSVDAYIKESKLWFDNNIIKNYI